MKTFYGFFLGVFTVYALFGILLGEVVFVLINGLAAVMMVWAITQDAPNGGK